MGPKSGGAAIPMRKNSSFDLVVDKTIEVLVGDPCIEREPLPVYSEEACAFLSDLSKRILTDRSAREYPDVISFGYWCRKANVNQRAAAFLEGKTCLRMGRGLALHIAPSNVPVNFAFSYVFALLAGNASIVRVPSKPFPQVRLILDAIRDTLDTHSAIAKRTVFVSYPSNSEATEKLSAIVDVRVIWGGDQTIESVRACKSKPRSKDIVFSDRYSFAMFDGGEIEDASSDELNKIASGFYNDTYLMDQNACSSPHLIVWLNATQSAKNRFWGAVRAIAEREYLLQPAVVMDKYVKLCEDCIDGAIKGKTEFDGLLSVVDLDSVPESIEETRGKGGYFYQIDNISLCDLAVGITERTQTLVYAGLDPERLKKEIMRSGLLGIDRIVPVGSAMDIDVIWDGYDLVSEMSRIIDVR